VGEKANPKQTLTVSPNPNRGRTSQFVGKTLVNPSSTPFSREKRLVGRIWTRVKKAWVGRVK